MWLEPDDTIYDLNQFEVEVLSTSALKRGMHVDPGRTRFTKAELVEYGLVREAFSDAEMISAGIGPVKVTSKDPTVANARSMLGVGSPHPSRIEKWQFPVDLACHHPVMISFPPDSRVRRRSQPAENGGKPGGALRVILSGSLIFDEVEYGPGEWFYIPNGNEYALASNKNQRTDVLYLLDFVSSRNGGRFSYEQ